MRRPPQNSLRALLMAMLAFFAGSRFQHQRRAREEAAARAASTDFRGVYLFTTQQTARRLGVRFSSGKASID